MQKNIIKKSLLSRGIALIITFFIITSIIPSKKRSNGTKKLYSNDKVTIVTYNIGDCTYGSANFTTSKSDAKKNLNNIISLIEESSYDVCLLQESNWLNITNYFINPSKKISSHFNDQSFIYGSNSNILNVFDSGNMTMTKYESTNKRLKVPIKGEGLINDKFYVHKLLIETRIKIFESDNELVIYNIHLAPFSNNRLVKLAQIKYILELAKLEYESGNFVVVGGDWNTNLSTKDQEKQSLNLELKKIFGDDLWKFKRLNSFTFQGKDKKGNIVNKTIDGFLFSPNIKGNVQSLENFEHSDHSPVELKLSLTKNKNNN
ncbi:MAG: hypothetical protein PHF21_04765 [Bacilli bacterium]|nr:hypothetical protein [Bacilli bacterium]